MNTFNIPSVDHLIEGVHYRLVDWSFAEGRERDRGLETNMPSRGAPSTFAEDCPEGEKMIFGACRKPGQKQGEKEFDSSKKTKQEEELEAEAKKQKSDVKNNKMIQDVKSGKKFGWAVKDGRPVLVRWGSVAGEKKVGPKPAGGRAAAAAPKPKEEKPERQQQQAPSTPARANNGNLAQEEEKRDLLPG